MIYVLIRCPGGKSVKKGCGNKGCGNKGCGTKGVVLIYRNFIY